MIDLAVNLVGSDEQSRIIDYVIPGLKSVLAEVLSFAM